MMTQNNFWTLIQKWGTFSPNTNEPPPFFRQVFSLKDKIIVPYDELFSASHDYSLSNLVPHMFIDDQKQAVFAEKPEAHSDALDKVFAVFSPDFSNFVNIYPQFNNTMILLNRLVASAWQQMGRYVVLTLSWAGKESFDVAFENIETGCQVAISTEGVNNKQVFLSGFKEAVQRIKPAKIFWKGTVPDCVCEIFDKQNIVQIEKRHDLQNIRTKAKTSAMQHVLF